jgi:NitT/TauT family transport system substrate-binding protein
VNISKRRARPLLVAATVLTLLATLAACSRAATSSGADTTKNEGAAATLHLGFLSNVTHASALIAINKGYFTKELGKTQLTTQAYNAGPDEVSALLGGSLDAAFLGSGPAITAFSKSNGGVVVVAGATSGGAQLVVKPNINSAADLKGQTVADPQLANTQDVSLKTWLANQNLTSQVKVANIANAQTITEFQKGDIQGAWVPEPYSSELVLQDGAKVLVDESSLWPQGQFPTTVLVVRTQYLQEHPSTVSALLRGQLDAVNYATSDKAGAEAATNAQLKTLSGKALPQDVIDRAFSKITLTFDPLISDFPALSKDQVTAKVVTSAPKVQGIASLTLLNQVLTAAGKPKVSAAGLGQS